MYICDVTIKTKNMKKFLIFIISVLVYSNSFSQATELTGCMGIKFGSTKEQVKEAVISKRAGFQTYKDEVSYISYTNGTFAGRECVGAIFMFYNNKLHTVKILLREDQDPKVFDLYKTVVSELETKYNTSAEKHHIFKKPYYEGDGYTVSAIKMGYADIASYINFADNNVISISITENLTTMILYQNTDMAQEAIDNNNQKRSQDY